MRVAVWIVVACLIANGLLAMGGWCRHALAQSIAPLNYGSFGHIADQSQEPDAAYFWRHARIWLGPEARLPNGISWRMVTDLNTAIALPRITWTSNRYRLLTADRLLDRLHGKALVQATATKSQAPGPYSGWREQTADRPFKQTDVALGYASSTLVSFINLGFWRPEGTGVPRFMQGVVLDLEAGSIFSVQRYGGEREPFGLLRYGFRLGNLIEACDLPSYDKIIAMLVTRATRVADAEMKSHDPNVARCAESTKRSIGSDQEIQLYLTFDGLAIYNTEFQPTADLAFCALRLSAVNPVVIPYRDLEPFMTPGPLKDELLAATK